MTIKKERALEIIHLLDAKRNELSKNEKASGDYWNGDDWGSISGFKDAKKWMNDSLATYLIELLN